MITDDSDPADAGVPAPEAPALTDGEVIVAENIRAAIKAAKLAGQVVLEGHSKTQAEDHLAVAMMFYEKAIDLDGIK